MSTNDNQATEKEKPTKARKQTPKFESKLLLDKNKGFEKLLKMFNKFDENKPLEGKEGLAIMMRYYQQWFYQLYPADFGDMCEKIDQFNGVKNICREFVDDRNGYSRYVQNIEEENESTNDNNKDNKNKSFLDDDDDIEFVKGNNNQNHEDPEVEAEILDLIGDQF